MNLHPVVAHAFSFTGAILIRRDMDGFRSDEVGYQIGLQQPRNHVRFVNVFIERHESMVYVKHDPGRVAELYQTHPNRVMPSEVAPKHWSKVRVPEGSTIDPWLFDMVDDSRALVEASFTRRGRDALAALRGAPNHFLAFHWMGLHHERAAKGRGYLSYSDAPETPSLSIDGRPIARFAWNALELTDRVGETRVLEATHVEEWRDALDRVVDSWLHPL